MFFIEKIRGHAFGVTGLWSEHRIRVRSYSSPPTQGLEFGWVWEVEMVGSLTAAFPDYLEPRKPPDGESGRQAL